MGTILAVHVSIAVAWDRWEVRHVGGEGERAHAEPLSGKRERTAARGQQGRKNWA